MSNVFSLTEKELQVMIVLWEEGIPLSSSEIIKKSPAEKKWKDSSIFIIIDSLVKKGAIKISGFTQNKTNYGRNFIPTLSQNDYHIMQIKQVAKERNIPITSLVAGMIEDVDIITVKKLKKIIMDRLELKE